MTGLLVYVIVWWLVFFVTLPFGISHDEEPEPGTVTSAPSQPRLWTKAAITTVVAAVLWTVVWYLVEADVFSFREAARGMG